MTYQLVLQLPGSCLEDYDSMVSLEDAIIEKLGDRARIDGHDVGANEINIFIWTDRPTDTFAEIEMIHEFRRLLDRLRVAFRETEGEDYIILRSPNNQQFSIA